jgi:transposase
MLPLDLLIGTMIEQLEFFEKQLAELDVHIQRLFSRMEQPIKTIPGIGSITGPLIAAELGDLRRFEGRRPIHAILAYAGMDPRVRKSGQWSGKIKMSKRGSTALRTALYQAASMARLHEPRLAEIYNRHKHHYMRRPTPPIEISRRPFLLIRRPSGNLPRGILNGSWPRKRTLRSG